MDLVIEKHDAIESRVLELLGKKSGTASRIDLDSSVMEDTGLDSVSVMDFVMEIEDDFDISIPLDRIAEMRTVGDLADAVRDLSRGNGATLGGPVREGL